MVKDEIQVFAVVLDGVRGAGQAVAGGGVDHALAQGAKVAELVGGALKQDAKISLGREDGL